MPDPRSLSDEVLEARELSAVIMLPLHFVGLYFCVSAAIAAFLHKALRGGLECRDRLFLIFLRPHLLLEARDV